LLSSAKIFDVKVIKVERSAKASLLSGTPQAYLFSAMQASLLRLLCKVERTNKSLNNILNLKTAGFHLNSEATRLNVQPSPTYIA
jgi:hypothetical protein